MSEITNNKKIKLDYSNEEKIDFEQIKKRINDKLERIKFNLENQDYNLKEYCNELRRQIQLDKEININKINDCADDLINKVNKFERDILEYQLKLNLDESTAKNIINETKLLLDTNNNTIENLKAIESKLNSEIITLNETCFDNKIIEYKNIELTSGNMVLHECNSVDFNQLRKIDLSSDILNVHIDLFFNHLEVKNIYIENLQFLSDGSFILFTSIGYFNMFVFIFDENFKFIHAKEVDHLIFSYDNFPFDHLYRSLLGIKISSDDKICIHYSRNNSYYERTIIAVLNEEFQIAKNEKIEATFLNGVSDDYIYLTDFYRGEIKIYDWNLIPTQRLGQIIDSNKEYYFGNGFSNLKSIRLNDSNEIYLLYCLFGYLYIINESNGKMVNKFKIDSNDFKIDINKNIVIFKDQYAIYYNLDGILINKIKLINFPLKKSMFVYDKIYFFDKLKHFVKF